MNRRAGSKHGLPGRPAWNQNARTPSPTPSPTSGRAMQSCGGIFDFDRKQQRLLEVNTELENPGVWNDAKRAQDLGREKKQLEIVVEGLGGIASQLRDLDELFALAREENDDATLVGIE